MNITKLTNSLVIKLTFAFLLTSTFLFSSVTGKIENSVTTTITADSVYAVTDKMPQFPGGDAARIEFLKQNVQYPDEAQKNQEQGRVIVQFVVDTLGKIKNAKVVKNISPSLDQEALRVINSFPAWIPGFQNGKSVSVYQVMPVSFKYTSVPKDSTAWDINDSTVIVIDSLKMPSNFNLSIINPNRVASVTVLKPFPEETKNALIRQYGTLAKNGVILLKTKLDELDSFQIIPDTTISISDSSNIQKKPEFPGGDDELFKFLSNKIKYPIIAQENGVQGRVVVQFVITSLGKIKNIKVLKSVDPNLDNEARRITSLMPDWTPAMLNGRPVNVRYTLPVNFRISRNYTQTRISNKSNIDEIYVTALMSNYTREQEWQKNDKTIVMLDNQRLNSGFDVSLILINNLANYVVLKPTNRSKAKKLVEQYGHDAVNGVIIITSKRQNINDNEIKIREISPAHSAIASQYGIENALNGPIKSKVINVDNSNQTNENNIIADKISIDGKVYNVVEQMPQFPGGDAALFKFISNNIKYPIVAAENHIQGRVLCFFVVEADGSISNVIVGRGVERSLDNEAVRVIESMPKWIPGKQQGKNVAVRYTLPVGFRLE